jgi:hypothetical protein
MRSWVRFWFTPADPVALHGLRLLAGLLFLAWLLTFAGQQEAFFGLGGWFDRQAYRDTARLPEGLPPTTGWSFLYLCGSNPALLKTAYWLSAAVLALFALGLWTRVTAVLAWVVVVSFVVNPAISYDADHLLPVLAFYLMVGYLLLGQWGKGQSLASRLLGPGDTWLLGRGPEGRPSYAANLAVRLLQVHFAIVVLVSGLHKLQFGDWWAGLALWYPLHPPFATAPATLRQDAAPGTSYLFFLSLAQYAVLAWQIGFPLFAWRKGWWRPVLLGGALLGWAGSVFLYRQPVFGPVLALGCLSYLTPAEWRSITNRLAGFFRRPAPSRRAVAPPHKPARVVAKT